MTYQLFLLFSLLLYSCQTHKPKTVSEQEELVKSIDALLNQHDFNGVIVLQKNDDIIYSKAKGYSDLEKQTPLKSDDQFVIGSISKQITAVLILRAYEKELLSLDDKMRKYLPGIKMDWTDEVSIHHLLTHTHGIQNLQSPLNFEAGTQFQYSQLGYHLLAQILEKISNKSFEELATALFDKHGLNNSFHPNNKHYKSLVKGYTPQEDGSLHFAQNSLRNYPAAGSFISNVPNLILWNQLLHQGKLVSKESLQLIKTKQTTRVHPVFESVDYSYGLMFMEGEADIQIGALGYAPGFVSASYYHPQSDLNFVILSNVIRDISDTKAAFLVQGKLLELLKEYK